MRRIEKISGRSDDMLIIRGVNVFPSQIEEQILKVTALSPHYVLEVSRPDRMDELKVIVEQRAGISEEDLSAASRELKHHIKTMIGVSTAIEITPPNQINRSVGKAKRIVDLRIKDE